MSPQQHRRELCLSKNPLTRPLPLEPGVQPETSIVPLPEAPVSITLKTTMHGHEVMVTMRGVDFFSVKAQVE